jgi:hypothetical protein
MTFLFIVLFLLHSSQSTSLNKSQSEFRLLRTPKSKTSYSEIHGGGRKISSLLDKFVKENKSILKSKNLEDNRSEVSETNQSVVSRFSSATTATGINKLKRNFIKENKQKLELKNNNLKLEKEKKKKEEERKQLKDTKLSTVEQFNKLKNRKKKLQSDTLQIIEEIGMLEEMDQLDNLRDFKEMESIVQISEKVSTPKSTTNLTDIFKQTKSL